MQFIADKHGRFLTVMPRTRAEDKWFRDHIQNHAMDWQEVHREENPRGQDLPDIVYRAVESPQRSAEVIGCCGIAVRRRRKPIGKPASAACKKRKPGCRRFRVARARATERPKRPRRQGKTCWSKNRWSGGCVYALRKPWRRITNKTGPGGLVRGPKYSLVKTKRYHVHFDEDGEAVARDAKCVRFVSADDTINN
jgi:hypothetical protein